MVTCYFKHSIPIIYWFIKIKSNWLISDHSRIKDPKEIPYVDPLVFNDAKYKLNEKSDIYSLGVILWEISSGQRPFYADGKQYDNNLAIEIAKGLREKPIPGTPNDYITLYRGKYKYRKKILLNSFN